jgi:hypothetical protein
MCVAYTHTDNWPIKLTVSELLVDSIPALREIDKYEHVYNSISF